MSTVRMIRKHMSVNIEGCLRVYKGRKINFMTYEDGSTVPSQEARKELNRLKSLGHKLMPCAADCDGFDPFGGGCPGHEVTDNSIHTNPEKQGV